jgi:thiamine-phosphate pyrophosphorylase
VIGLDGLRAVCDGHDALPVVAIGGVTAGNAAAAMAAGCAGVAVVAEVFAAASPQAAAHHLRQTVDDALAARV